MPRTTPTDGSFFSRSRVPRVVMAWRSPERDGHHANPKKQLQNSNLKRSTVAVPLVEQLPAGRRRRQGSDAGNTHAGDGDVDISRDVDTVQRRVRQGNRGAHELPEQVLAPNPTGSDSISNDPISRPVASPHKIPQRRTRNGQHPLHYARNKLDLAVGLSLP